MPISFEGFVLDVERRELRCGTQLIAIGPQVFDLLVYLISNHERVVSKDELLDVVWGGRTVSLSTLGSHVHAMRHALGDSGEEQRLIRTVARRGFRFIGELTEAPGAADAASGYLLAGLGGSELAGLEQPARQAPASSEDPRAVSDEAAAEPDSHASHPDDVQILERRQLTLISCELVGAARLATLLDPEDLAAAVSGLHRRCSEIVASFGGNVTRIAGGTILGCFGYPQAGEHDAEQAVRAGLALLDGIHDRAIAGRAIEVRIGIATGPVVVDFAEERRSAGGLIGETVVLAAASQRTAEPGTVVIAESTRRLVGDLFDLRRRGKLAPEGLPEPIESYTVLGASTVTSRFEAMHGPLLTPLVGREEEIELLLRRWQGIKSGELRAVLITGEPGIGKSRLCVELRDRIRHQPHAFIRYFCSPHHQDSALHPVIRQLEATSGFERSDGTDAKLAKFKAFLSRESAASEADMALLADMLSLGGSRSVAPTGFTAHRRRELTFEALIRHLNALAMRHPMLVVFEDAHWSDPTTLELLDLALRRLAPRRVLVLITFRPEFAPPWTAQSHFTTLTLSRLDRREGATLVRRTIGEHTLANELVEAIVEQADGVPLFLEELGKALAEAEPTAAAGGSLLPMAIPTTLQASLLARLDQLPHAKQVAQIAAAIGRVFPYALLAAVSRLPAERLARGLEELVGAGLATAYGIPPEATYTFKHALVQDVAYESLRRSRRGEVHAAVVAACEKTAAFDVEPGVLAHHSAQAGLSAKAAFYYRLAAERSIERAAVAETRRQLQRGLAFAATLRESVERDELEAELLLALATVLQTTTSMSNAEAGQLYARAANAGRSVARPQLLSRVLWGQFTNMLVRGEVVAAHAIAEQLLDRAEACGDVHTQLAAQAAMGIALFYQGHFDSARRHLTIQQSILEPQSAAAELDWRTMTAGPAFLALTLACLGYPERAAIQLGRAVDLASRKGAFALAYGLSVAVRVSIVLRDDDALRDHAMRLITLSEDGGFHQFLNQGLCALGWLEIRTGAPERGLARLRHGLADMFDLAAIAGLPFYRSLLADMPSVAAERLAALDQALELSGRTADTWFTAELHRRRAELLADPALAETELQQALAIARGQSAKLFELRAAAGLTRLWAAQRNRDAARDLLVSVHGWFKEGFDRPDLSDARRLLDELVGPPGRSRPQ